MDTGPILAFSSNVQFEKWLKVQYAKSDGIWIRFFKKASGKKTVVYKEALDVALCYGWIDSQVRKFDTESYIQKFTPRRTRSMWSQVNREHVARLIKEKRMRAPGLAEVERAKKDGRWDAAYASPKNTKVPVDFLKALEKNKKATAFFKTLNRANIYAIAWQLHNAKKTETRERRIIKFVAMLAREEKLY